MTGPERSLLEALDALLSRDRGRSRIEPILHRVQRDLLADPAARMAWEPIPLTVYGDALPPAIRSSWVFVLRAGVVTGAERHPNSHQRMTSVRGSGDLQTGGEGRWRSHPLVSGLDEPLERRWASIPPMTWHQAVVPEGEDWQVVSFHTAPAEELIEERPDAAGAAGARRRLYLIPGQKNRG